jgi:hypothetical protein
MPLLRRSLRLDLRFAIVAVVFVPLLPVAGAGVGCGPQQIAIWFCDNPDSGKLDPGMDPPDYDANHYVGGVFDPCHCYDPCGPAPTCPIAVDAGPTPAGCDAGGTGGGAGG